MIAAKQIVPPEPIGRDGRLVRYSFAAAWEHASERQKVFIAVCVLAAFALAIYLDITLK